MAQKKQIKEEIITNTNLRLLTRSFQDHALGQMNAARYSVLNSREFTGELSEVFLDVKTSYKNSVLNQSMKNVTKKNGRDAWVLLTANKKLYGDLLPRICRLFAERVKSGYSDNIDLIVVGKQGKKYMDDINLNVPYKYYELPETNVSLEVLKKLLEDLFPYENVIAYYGKFKTLMSQDPVESNLAGGVKSNKEQLLKDNNSMIKSGINTKKHNFLFEPGFEEIFTFFESQIFSHIFNQVVQEAQLAKFASRINAMEEAQTNIDKRLSVLNRRDKLLRNIEINKKQQELLSGRALWARK